MSRKQNMARWNGIASQSLKPTIDDLLKDEVVETPVKTQMKIALDDNELEHRRRANQIELDLRIARSYNSKSDDARNRNLQFGLTLNDWTKLMSQPTCLYSGVVFSTRGDSPNARSMERVNPVLGYTPENTIAVTKAANQEKSSLDAFVKGKVITNDVKLKLLRKATYQIEKLLKMKG